MSSLARAPQISEAEFAALTVARGFAFSAEELADLYQAYGMVEAMVERVRSGRAREAAPAFVFDPAGAAR
jgi:hypothetical protein